MKIQIPDISVVLVEETMESGYSCAEECRPGGGEGKEDNQFCKLYRYRIKLQYN